MPLHEAVYERLEVGTGTRLLGLGCGSGLALLMAASRGAAVTGVDSRSPERVALARERLLPQTWGTRARADTRLVDGAPEDVADVGAPAFNLVTAFEPIGCVAGDSEGLAELLDSATPLAERGLPWCSPGGDRRSAAPRRPCSGSPPSWPTPAEGGQLAGRPS